MMPLEKLLSMQEAADTLDVTKKTLLELVRQGKIAFVNVGTGTERVSRKFRPSDLARFIQAHLTVCQPPSHDTGHAKRRRRDPALGVAEGGGVRAILARQQSAAPRVGDLRARLAGQAAGKPPR